MSKNFKITVAYDGTSFLGWQRQAKGPTIQALLEDALAKVCQHQITLHGSGRTDAGVHALGQVASFITTSSRNENEIVRGGNTYLPHSIAILAAEEVTLDFHARYSVKSKTYTYDFLTEPIRNPLLAYRSWRVGPNLQWNKIQDALQFLLGEKDFSAFQSTGSDIDNPVRQLYQADLLNPETNLIRLSLTGSGFLRHMVRTIAGTLWLLGRGKLEPQNLQDIIESKDRSRAGPVAPPQGLCLKQVHYLNRS